jgi:hypothetical protein
MGIDLIDLAFRLERKLGLGGFMRARALKVAALLSMCWLPLSCGPSVTAVLDSAEVAVQPVVDALRAYRSRHAGYPAALDDLVRDGLLPRLPAHHAEKLEYEVSDHRDIFLLAISQHDYSFQVGPGDTFYRCLFSDVGRWQSLKGYPGLARHLEDPTYPGDSEMER